MVTILPALGQVRKDLVEHLDRATVEQVYRELDHEWRDGPLDPFTTLHLFILQVLHRNTAMTHLPHLVGEQFTASAYCQARQRLPVAFFERLVNAFSRDLESSEEDGRWRGHRTGHARRTSVVRAFPRRVGFDGWGTATNSLSGVSRTRGRSRTPS